MAYDVRNAVPEWGHRHTALSLCAGSYFTIRLAQLLISPVIPALRDAFAVSRGTVGLALTGMWAVYALAQLPSGVFGDRYGPRGVVVVALGCTTAGAAALAAAPSMVAFGAFALVLGAGAGLYYNAATALLTARFDDVGRAIGLHRVGSQVAGLAAPVLAAAVAARFGWRAALGSGAVVAVGVLGLVVSLVRPTAPTRPDASVSELIAPRTLARLLGRPRVAFTAALSMLGEFTVLATMAFLPTFFVEHHGLSLSRASLLFSIYFATVAGLQPVVGWLSDRFGRDAVVGCMFAAGVGGFATLAATTGFAVALPGVVLVGVAMSWVPPLQSRAVDALSAAERGTGFGLVRTVYLLGGALGTTVVGSVADVAGWTAGFGLLAALLGAGVVALAGVHAAGLEW
jgi:MFS family permease